MGITVKDFLKTNTNKPINSFHTHNACLLSKRLAEQSYHHFKPTVDVVKIYIVSKYTNNVTCKLGFTGHFIRRAADLREVQHLAQFSFSFKNFHAGFEHNRIWRSHLGNPGSASDGVPLEGIKVQMPNAQL